MKNLVFLTFFIVLYALVELISCDEEDAINFLNSFLKHDKWKNFRFGIMYDFINNKRVYKKNLNLVETPYKGKNYVTKKNLSERLNVAMLLVNYLYTDSLIFVTAFLTEQKSNCDSFKELLPVTLNRDELDECVKILKSFIITTRDVTELYIGVINYIKNLSDTIETDYFILPFLEELDKLAVKLKSIKDNVDQDMELIWKTMTDFKIRLDKVVKMYHIHYTEYQSSKSGYSSYQLNIDSSKSVPLTFTDYLQNKLLHFTERCIRYDYTNLGFKYDKENHETIYEKD